MNSVSASLAPQPMNALRVSWGAVFVGLLLAMMTYLFLGVLGTAIGASALDPMGERNPLAGFGTGAGIWVAVSTLVSLAIGGFFAGRSSPQRGALHGVLCWSMTTLVTLYMLSSLAGGAIGTASGVARAGLSVAGQGVAAAAPGIASGVKGALKSNGIDIDMTDVQGQLETLLRQTGKPALDPSNLKASAQDAASEGTATAASAAATPQKSANDLSSFFDRLKQKAYPTLDAADKEALVNVIMARTGKSRPEAQTIADNYEQTYNQALEKYRSLKIQAEQKARQAGEAAASGVSHAAWAGVVILLLGALVSGFAGFLGRRSNPLREEVVV